MSKVSERWSSASKRANGRASGPVLKFAFLVVLEHSVTEAGGGEEKRKAGDQRKMFRKEDEGNS